VRRKIGAVRARLTGRSGRLACVTAALCGAALLVAGCGTTTTASGGSSSSSGFAAYRTCLQQHGVTLPSPGPSGAPGGGFGGGGFGGGGGFPGGGGSSSGSSTFQKAAAACASLRPSFGGAGFGGGGFSGFAQAFQAFRSCMSDHGEPIPTTRPSTQPSPGTSPQDRFLNGLNPDNSKVAAALKACESKLPSFGSNG
jgi:hypothetical protein